jgi:hypothetical protein
MLGVALSCVALPLLVVPAAVLPVVGWWFARALARRASA